MQVVEKEYQPINTSRGRRGERKAQVLMAMRPKGDEGEGHGRGAPSLFWVFVKTYSLPFLLSMLYILAYDLLDFANPLLLK